MDAFYLHHQGHIFLWIWIVQHCVDHGRCHIHKALLGVYSEGWHLPGALHRQQQCTTAVQSAGGWEDTTFVREGTLGSISGSKWRSWDGADANSLQCWPKALEGKDFLHWWVNLEWCLQKQAKQSARRSLKICGQATPIHVMSRNLQKRFSGWQQLWALGQLVQMHRANVMTTVWTVVTTKHCGSGSQSFCLLWHGLVLQWLPTNFGWGWIKEWHTMSSNRQKLTRSWATRETCWMSKVPTFRNFEHDTTTMWGKQTNHTWGICWLRAWWIGTLWWACEIQWAHPTTEVWHVCPGEIKPASVSSTSSSTWHNRWSLWSRHLCVRSSRLIRASSFSCCSSPFCCGRQSGGKHGGGRANIRCWGVGKRFKYERRTDQNHPTSSWSSESSSGLWAFWGCNRYPDDPHDCAWSSSVQSTSYFGHCKKGHWNISKAFQAS